MQELLSAPPGESNRAANRERHLERLEAVNDAGRVFVEAGGAERIEYMLKCAFTDSHTQATAADGGRGGHGGRGGRGGRGRCGRDLLSGTDEGVFSLTLSFASFSYLLMSRSSFSMAPALKPRAL